MLPCPDPKAGNIWGDWYFARSLANAFERRDISVYFDFAVRGRINDAAQRFFARGQVDLAIRGKRPVRPRRNRPYFIWLISHPNMVSTEEFEGAAHVFVASQPFAETLAKRGISCTFLPQCTDRDIFFPHGYDPARASDVLFVGNRRRYAPRPVVDLALKEKLDLQVWGRGWADDLPGQVWRGPSIPNEQLSSHYSSANIVLNDHTPAMLNDGFASNRIFDVLASGTALLTEAMRGLPDVVATFCHQYTNETFGEAIELARRMPRASIDEASQNVLTHHTFDNRAEYLMKVMGS